MKKQSLKLPTIDVTKTAKDPTGILASVALKASDIEPTDQIYREFENTNKKFTNYRLQTRKFDDSSVKKPSKSSLPHIGKSKYLSRSSDKNTASLPSLKELSLRVRNVCQDARNSCPDVTLTGLGHCDAGNPCGNFGVEPKSWEDSMLRSILHYVRDGEGNMVPSINLDDAPDSSGQKEVSFGSHKLCACRTHQHGLSRASLATPTTATSSAQDLGLLRRDGACFFRPDYTSVAPRCDYDSDAEYDLRYSLTLPRIEAVLKSEGIKPHSISQQIEKIRDRCKRSVEEALFAYL